MSWVFKLNLRDWFDYFTVFIMYIMGTRIGKWLADGCEDVCPSKHCQCVHYVWECATQYKTCALRFFFLCWLKVQPAELGMYAVQWGANTSIPAEAPSSCPGVSTQLSDSNYTHAKKLQTACEMFPRESCSLSVCVYVCQSSQFQGQCSLNCQNSWITGF